MPIPTPQANESQQDYVKRAHEALASEFPDTDQRNAVIFKKWREAKGQSEEEKVAHSRFSDHEYTELKDIPVFKEHSYIRILRNPDGSPKLDNDGNPLQTVETYGYEELKSMVDNCNKRVLETKSFSPITDIHTGKPKPDRSGYVTPGVLGFAGPYKLGMLGNEQREDGSPLKGKWTIFANEFWFKDKAYKAREFPRRSPEVFVGRPIHQRFLDPITALGAETPALDMGIHYSLNPKTKELVERYSAPNITVRYASDEEAYFTNAGRLDQGGRAASLAALKASRKTTHEKAKEYAELAARSGTKEGATKIDHMNAADNHAIAAAIHREEASKGYADTKMHAEAAKLHEVANQWHRSIEQGRKQNYDAMATAPCATNVSPPKEVNEPPTQKKNKVQYEGEETMTEPSASDYFGVPDEHIEEAYDKLKSLLQSSCEECMQKAEDANSAGDKAAARLHEKQLDLFLDELTKADEAFEKHQASKTEPLAEEKPEEKPEPTEEPKPDEEKTRMQLVEAIRTKLATDITTEIAKYSADPDTVNACVNAVMNLQIFKRIESFLDSQDAPVNPKEEQEQQQAEGIEQELEGAERQEEVPGEVQPAAEEQPTGEDNPPSEPAGLSKTGEPTGNPPEEQEDDMTEKERMELQTFIANSKKFQQEMTVKYSQQEKIINELREANQELRQQGVVSSRNDQILALRRAGYVFNEREAVAKYSQVSDEAFSVFVDTVKVTAERVPFNPGIFPTPGLDLPDTNQAQIGQYGGASLEDTVAITQYALAKQAEGEILTWEQAKAQYKRNGAA